VPYLADTSAWSRSTAVADRWDELRDELFLCSTVRLELLYSARSPATYQALCHDLSTIPDLPLDDDVCATAERAQALLADASKHRGPAPIDLLVAATAEAYGVTLLHYDRHFDAIGDVTGQPMEWLAPRGSLG
jgi:predicted nucleic acid-binding protein